MEKEYCFEIKVVWSQCVVAKNKKEAVSTLRDSFEKEFNFKPSEKEIKEIK